MGTDVKHFHPAETQTKKKLKQKQQPDSAPHIDQALKAYHPTVDPSRKGLCNML